MLVHDPSLGGSGERTVYGGLKTKEVDVVVTKEGIGPVLAVSCKGAIGAFRNLTNRMEEAIGECTNLHIAYPPLVCGYVVVMRANRAEEVGVVPEQPEPEQEPPRRLLKKNDVAIDRQGRPVALLRRFHAALRELADRRGIRNDVSRYEAIALALASTRAENVGSIVEEFPDPASPYGSSASSRRCIANMTNGSSTVRSTCERQRGARNGLVLLRPSARQ